MNHGIPGKIGWVALPSYVEYQSSDKRNRNPNWTDSEITRFLTILMEEPVLNDLNAQRNKQVFCYVSRKMAGEGSEKTWDQCRVKLKNLKSQWRYVKDRLPGIEEADLDNEDAVRQLMHECQARGVSPSCIKHLRLLKQFLVSLAAVRKGISPPRYKTEVNFGQMEAEQRMQSRLFQQQGEDERQMKLEYQGNESFNDDDNYDEADARLVVEAGISPPVSPESGVNNSVAILGHESNCEDEDQIVIEGENPLGPKITETKPSQSLRVMSPNDINYISNKKRPSDTDMGQESGTASKRMSLKASEQDNLEIRTESLSSQVPSSREMSTPDILQKFQREMMDKFLQFQRESEVRFLAWEQERWRMEQNLLDRWRSEQRNHEKEMFSMFCGLLSQCSQTILDNTKGSN